MKKIEVGGKKRVTVEEMRETFPMPFDKLPLSVRKKVDPVVNNILEWILNTKEARRVVEENIHLSCPIDFIEGMIKSAKIEISVPDEELKKIPAGGRLIVACNHPTGIPDMAIVPMIGRVRKDIRLVINPIFTRMTGHAEVPGILINVPVFTDPNEKQRREFRSNIRRALERDKALIFFPAAEVSHYWRKLPFAGTPEDTKWKSGISYYAEETAAPILPVFIRADKGVNPRNSNMFYFLRMLGPPGQFLSQLLIFRELFSHNRRVSGNGSIKFEVSVRRLIYPEEVMEMLGEYSHMEIADYIKKICYGLN